MHDLRVFRGLVIGGILGGLLWLGLAQAATAAMGVGFDWVPANLPPGESPQSALARFGGTVYRAYDHPFQSDAGPEKLRLVNANGHSPMQQDCNGTQQYHAWGMCPAQITQYTSTHRGLTYILGNEGNLCAQDCSLKTQSQAPTYARWYKTIRDAIKTGDPTAKVIPTSTWNWDGGGSSCCTQGRDALNWFVDSYRQQFGWQDPPTDGWALQIHPWTDQSWADPGQYATAHGLRQVDGLKNWYRRKGKPIYVTEWGLRRLGADCSVIGASEGSRGRYTRDMLSGMQARGVVTSLYFASHQQVCSADGWYGNLVQSDGSLTVEGLAHRQFALGY
jgi:hypothetical protein